MKILPNLNLHTVAGEILVVNQGTRNADFTRVISLNASARLLWEELFGKDFTEEEAAAVLVGKYHISQEQAILDAERWIEALRKCDVITD